MVIMFQVVGDIHIQIPMIMLTNTLILDLREFFGFSLQVPEEDLLGLKL